MPILNINKNFEIIKASDKKFKPKDLSLFFIEMITKNGFKVLEFKDEGAIKYLKTYKNGKTIEIYFLIRNVAHSGWSKKPHIKRIQVQNFSIDNPELFSPSDKNVYFFFVGYYNFDNNPLFIFWDPGRYTEHKTNRSCYVFLNTLLMAYKEGYVDSINMNRKVWVIDDNNFEKFLINYSSVIDRK
ncbi:MAG: hypothetical protein WC006_07000 [Bacilli bacterium]